MFESNSNERVILSCAVGLVGVIVASSFAVSNVISALSGLISAL